MLIVIVKGCRSSKERSPIYEVENGMKGFVFCDDSEYNNDFLE